MSQQEVLFAALALAAEGIACFPCRPNKWPATPHGFRNANTDADALRELWRRYPGPLVGAATGAVSGIDALDIDAKHSEARAWWTAHRLRIPTTRTHRTRSGGLHLLFRHRDGIRCSAGRIALGVDVRGDGGYIVWWPAAGLPVLIGGAMAGWPDWILAELLPPPAQPVAPARAWSVPAPSGERARRYAFAALHKAVVRIASTPEGGRNDVLNRETFGLARLIRDHTISPRELAEAMAHAALAAGLSPRETECTIASALGAGGTP